MNPELINQLRHLNDCAGAMLETNANSKAFADKLKEAQKSLKAIQKLVRCPFDLSTTFNYRASMEEQYNLYSQEVEPFDF